MYQFKRMATMALAASMCLAMLAGCGNKQTEKMIPVWMKSSSKAEAGRKRARCVHAGSQES